MCCADNDVASGVCVCVYLCQDVKVYFDIPGIPEAKRFSLT